MRYLNLIKMRFFEVEMLIHEKLPKDLAKIIIGYLQYPAMPWDAYDMWVPEYDTNGNYGHVPMCPVDLPGLTNSFW